MAVFNALSAVAGGVGMLLTDGLGMPRSFLDNSPFNSFLVPALILLIVIGGTQTLATVLLIGRRASALLWTAVAGFAMLIWILTETVMIQGFSWLQALYFATGGVELILVLALLGIVSWLPRAADWAPAVRAGNGRRR
ncbi:hypothetical protein RBS60_10560 [Sinomonas sp. ASV486]|uniref:Uncharacterized protein n=1 Tax=Sinomonas puerhi TaxID=3238584 RepID=A0AB39KZ82_9MICC|nr:hypothetical protein [Sinomonas sp. ASV486]MDQ4490642.1 hypothetical protein [Sinomonas sp. ASV486]